MVSKMRIWGYGPGLRLSKPLLEKAGISVGDEVEIVVRKHQIVVRKAGTKPKYDIKELVSRIPKGYKGMETSLGPAVGKEEW